jgi:hypothetical protein
MKKLFIAICLFAFTNGAWAQSNKEDVEIIQSVYGKDKKDLVAAYMSIPESKKTAFWKMYDEYETSRKTLGKQKIKLIEEYINGYESLDDAKSTRLFLAMNANNMQYEKLYEVWFKKFSTVIGGKEAGKMFQLETYLQTAIRIELLDGLPFIGELKKH